MKIHTDPIADLLTRIRNAQAVNKQTAVVGLSKINVNLLAILKENSYIKDMEMNIEERVINIYLDYDQFGKPKIKHIKRVSKPGRRVYVDKNNIKKVLNDYGIAILSTNRGLMTNKEARKQNLGGEIICEVY